MLASAADICNIAYIYSSRRRDGWSDDHEQSANPAFVGHGDAEMGGGGGGQAQTAAFAANFKRMASLIPLSRAELGDHKYHELPLLTYKATVQTT